jgi:hypothetical protein
LVHHGWNRVKETKQTKKSEGADKTRKVKIEEIIHKVLRKE